MSDFRETMSPEGSRTTFLVLKPEFYIWQNSFQEWSEIETFLAKGKLKDFYLHQTYLKNITFCT